MDLDEAFRKGKEDFIIAHMKNGYDVELDPKQLLLKSAHYSRVKALQACLELGISPNSHNALSWACGKGKLLPIKLLISAGSNVNAKDDYCNTPIVASAARGKLNEIKFLLENGANPEGALLAAVSGEYIKLVEFLLNIEVNLEEVSEVDLSALSIACMSSGKKSIAIAELLIEGGANVNFVRESDGQTPLKFAATYSTSKVIQSLINKGAEVDGPKGTDQTALMLAARSNSVERVKVLINNGANHQLQCGLGWAKNATAKGLAEMENCRKVVKFFSQL